MLPEPEQEAIGLVLPDHAATERLGADLAQALRPGDCVYLHGDLGAGKTALARGLVRALADPHEEVPSPTFTLVQHYDGRVPVLHSDLYRIADPREVDELGLDEALDAGIVLVEWPGRGGDALPPPTLEVELEPVEDATQGDGRNARLWGPVLDRAKRSLRVRAFLAALGRADAPRRHLTGDASARSYETVPDGSALPPVLMNAPATPDGPAVHDGLPYSRVAHLAEDVRPFVALATALSRRGFAAPRVFAADMDAGLLLIENLGQGTIVEDGRPVPERYEASARLLARLHGMEWPREFALPDGGTHRVPDFDRGAIQVEVSLLADWYARDVLHRDLSPAERNRFVALWDVLAARLEREPPTLVLRDFHSPNIVWRDERTGDERIGLIDFQDAVFGPAAYDLASLAQDARVDVSPELEARLLDSYCDERWGDASEAQGARDALRETYAIAAAQRASKILGIFVRLDLRDGKPD